MGLSQEILEQLNPGLAESGLKAGMVLKVPKTSIDGVDLAAMEETRLTNQLKFFRPKSIALILPFKANTIHFDSIQSAKQQIHRDGYIRIATEFYAGVEMALDSAKRLGISTTLDVLDSEANSETVRRLIQTHDFSKYDVVLGPLTLENSNIIAQTLQSSTTAVVSPFVKFNQRTANLIQTIPDDEWMADKLLRHAQKDSTPHQSLIISDSKSINRAKKNSDRKSVV